MTGERPTGSRDPISKRPGRTVDGGDEPFRGGPNVGLDRQLIITTRESSNALVPGVGRRSPQRPSRESGRYRTGSEPIPGCRDSPDLTGRTLRLGARTVRARWSCRQYQRD